MKLSALNIIGVVAVSLLLGAVVVLWQRPWPVLGSVEVGNQYQSTTTPAVADATNLCPARVGMASSTTGVLGAVNFLEANTGTLTIYDATTTNTTLRAHSTTTAILAEFPASPTEGSYHFDVEFKRGLLVDYSNSNTAGTTTISYRCEG